MLWKRKKWRQNHTRAIVQFNITASQTWWCFKYLQRYELWSNTSLWISICQLSVVSQRAWTDPKVNSWTTVVPTPIYQNSMYGNWRNCHLWNVKWAGCHVCKKSFPLLMFHVQPRKLSSWDLKRTKRIQWPVRYRKSWFSSFPFHLDVFITACSSGIMSNRDGTCLLSQFFKWSMLSVQCSTSSCFTENFRTVCDHCRLNDPWAPVKALGEDNETDTKVSAVLLMAALGLSK